MGKVIEERVNGANLDRLKSDKAKRFALEYPKDHNATAAAIRAGYSKKTATQSASRLLKHPVIKAYLGKLERLDVEKLEIDRHEALRQLYYALTRDLAEFVNEDGTLKLPHELPKRCRSIIDSYKAKILRTEKNGDELREVEYRLTPHAVAREQAMKHKGLFAPEILDVKVGVSQDFLSRLSEPLPIDEVEVRLIEEENKQIEERTDDDVRDVPVAQKTTAEQDHQQP